MAGAAIGFVIGFILGMSGIDLQRIGVICRILGFIVAIPISFACFKWSVKRFIIPQLGGNARAIELYRSEE